MKHLKKYNENTKDNDIFSDESILHDILSEYVECHVKYSLTYKIFRLLDEYFIPVRSDIKFSGLPLYDNKAPGNTNRKGCQVKFTEFFSEEGYYATDVPRGENQRLFGIPGNNLYRFFEITKEVQYRLESMGYIFLLSTHKNGEFDFMIIEKY